MASKAPFILIKKERSETGCIGCLFRLCMQRDRKPDLQARGQKDHGQTSLQTKEFHRGRMG